MKKITTILATVALLFTACSKELADPNVKKNNNTTSEQTGEVKYLTFTADISATKTVTDFAAGKTEWEEGDEIVITYEGESYTYVAESAGPSSIFVPKESGIPAPAEGA